MTKTLSGMALLLMAMTISVQATPASLERIDSYVNSDPDSAIILCDKALEKVSTGEASYRAKLLTIRGNAYFTLGDSPKAIADFTEAVSASESVTDTMACVNALSDLGVAYRVNQQPDSALNCYNRALTMLAGRNLPSEEASLLTSIAVLFANQGRFKDAVPFAEKGLSKAMLTDDIETQIYAASSLGSALFLSGEHERGLDTQREIVKVAERKGVPRYILKTYASIIAMHNRLGNPDSVRYYIDLGERLLPQVPEGSIEAIGFLEQSFVVLTAIGHYKESLDIQHRIIDMKDSRPFMPLDRLWQRIALNYKGLGDIENMDAAYRKAIEISDSIHRSDIDGQISEFDIKYGTAEKELEIARLEAEKARRDLMLATIASVAVIAVIMIILWLRSRKRKIELDNIRARLDGIEQERGRLSHELHDGVCNDLLGIELMAARSGCDTGEIMKMIGSVRSEVRSISHELLPPRFGGVSLGQLLASLALKNGDNTVFSSEGDDRDISPAKCANLYRIVQEWTGNLRRHGNASSIKISLKVAGGRVNLSISDNGDSVEVDDVAGKGLGIENISRRVKAMRGTWSVTRLEKGNLMSVDVPDGNDE